MEQLASDTSSFEGGPPFSAEPTSPIMIGLSPRATRCWYVVSNTSAKVRHADWQSQFFQRMAAPQLKPFMPYQSTYASPG